MALTEIQRPTKEELYSSLKAISNEMYRYMERWEAAAAVLTEFTAADLDTIGVPATGGERTDMVKLRTVLEEVVSLWGGNAVTPTNNPKDVINAIRSILSV